MKKTLRFWFVALLAVMGFGNAMAEDVIWQEDFSSYAKDDVPTGGTYNYVCADNGTNITKIYDANLAGGTSPELLVGKSKGSFTATIDLGGKSGDMTLSFKCNKNIPVEVTGGTLGEKTATGNDYVYPITGASGTLTIKFNNTTSANARLDDIKLYQGQGKKPAGLSWGTSSRTVTIGASDNVFPTLSNENNLAVTYSSSEQSVATIAADGAITLVAAGQTVITASSQETAEYEAGHAQYTLTVNEGTTTPTETSVATIAALNALNNNDAFVFTGEALVVYLSGRYAYIKDETGSSLIYDNGSTKVANLVVGKKIAANWTGKVSIYKNLFETVPDNELTVTADAAVDVVYPEVGVTDVKADNMNQVVTLKDVTYTAPEGKNFTIKKEGTEIKGYNQFGLEIAAPADGKTYDITGVISVYNTDVQFQPIGIVEVTPATPDTWTVAGTEPLVNKSWDPSDATADMTSTDGVIFTYVKEEIVLEKGTEYKFKVVKNHAWDEAYPGSDYVVKVDETAIYKATITFNASTKEVGCQTEKTGTAGPVTHTYGLVGSLVGSWDNDVEMTLGDDGLYKAVVENVAKGNYEFKVRADHAWDISYPSSNYKLSVEQDGSTVTVTFNEETKAVDATVVAGSTEETNRIWDFTKWSEATIANLKADAAASKTSGWSDVEKKTDAENNADPTDISKDNCFWSVAEPNADGELAANGVVIEELKGLKWNSTYSTARSLAIAVNYPATSLGNYAGPAYLWLGGGSKSIPCFTIPAVAAGSIITMEVESHKPTDARGVELYTGVTEEGKIDAATKIGDSFKPTTKDTYSWTIETAGDVIVYNTSGCHIYKLIVGDASASVVSVKAEEPVKGIYNLAGQRLEKAQKGLNIINGKKVMIK